VNLHVINPLADHRWDDLVARHPRASAFHQRGWLLALSRTYGYEPLALTSSPAGHTLADGLVLCRVASWITGTRLVSLPFTDHCEPLLNQFGEAEQFMQWLRTECGREGWKYVELRPLSPLTGLADGWRAGQTYAFHRLDLSPGLEQIFRGLHKNSMQRKIQRAERESLSYESGRSAEMIDEFFRLVVLTRRRQRLLPQPRRWFHNLAECMGDKLQIRLARKNGAAIAGILTLQHGASVIYKYGCSDEKFHNLGGMPYLFWRLIEESQAAGAKEIDFGRSDLDNQGLITFKDRLGAKRSCLTYQRFSGRKTEAIVTRWNSRTLRRLVAVLPDAVLSAGGEILYKHMG
jgi:CelD/BcsL family acetyltransferase involved in cellulose biosynthesis